MNITLLNKTVTTDTNKGGKPYQVMEVAYKNNTFQGKVEGKKITSYAVPAFNILAEAENGTSFEVTVEKDKGGYNQWTKMVRADAEQTTTAFSSPPPAESATRVVATKSSNSWETADERAKRQVYIIRQSSVSSAVAILSAGAKNSPKLDDVINTAKQIESYVLGTGFDDLPVSDLPDVNIV